MRVIMLAAGMGKRLKLPDAELLPKCLLEFAGGTLLQRHLELLGAHGIREIVLVVGYGAARIAREIDRLQTEPQPALEFNPHYQSGSIVSLWTARKHLLKGGDVLLMDADVLYDARLLQRLLQSPHANCFLLDRDFEPGEEPVKLCIREGRVVEFSKRVAPELSFDFRGESVGFFRFSEPVARRLVDRIRPYIEAGLIDVPYEEAIRDLVLNHSPTPFGFEDVSGLPWIEIDFAEDVRRARMEIVPRLADGRNTERR